VSTDIAGALPPQELFDAGHGGESLSGNDDFLRRLGRKTSGSRAEVALLRNNRELTVEIVVP
jgi:hypothetical protein